MSKKGNFANLIDPGMLDSFMMTSMGPAGAVAEFADNTFGPAAGNTGMLVVVNCRDGVIFADKGAGLMDLGQFFVIGASGSRTHATDAGSFGVGSKKGAFVFGMRIEVHTVREGDYRTHTTDWAEVRANPGSIELYDGTVRPLANAPEFIRKGGTMICVTRPHRKGGRGWTELPAARGEKVRPEHLRALASMFSPGLRGGHDIRLYNDRNTVAHCIAKGFTMTAHSSARSQLNSLEAAKHATEVSRTVAEVEGMPLTLVVSQLGTGNADLSGIHIDFGYRRVEHWKQVGGMVLDPRVYVRVVLDPAWKHCLNDVKTHLVHERAKVQALVADAVRELNDTLSGDKASQRSMRLRLRLGAALTTTLSTSMRAAHDGKWSSERDDDGATTAPTGGRGKGGGGGDSGGTRVPRPRTPKPGDGLTPADIKVDTVPKSSFDEFTSGDVTWNREQGVITIQYNTGLVAEDDVKTVMVHALWLLAEFFASESNTSLRSHAFGDAYDRLGSTGNLFAFMRRNAAEV